MEYNTRTQAAKAANKAIPMAELNQNFTQALDYRESPPQNKTPDKVTCNRSLTYNNRIDQDPTQEIYPQLSANIKLQKFNNSPKAT